MTIGDPIHSAGRNSRETGTARAEMASVPSSLTSTSSSSSSVSTLVEAAGAVFGLAWPSRKRKHSTEEEDLDCIDPDSAYHAPRPPPSLRRQPSFISILAGPSSSSSSAAATGPTFATPAPPTTTKSSSSKKRARDWDDEEDEEAHDADIRTLVNLSDLPRYSECLDRPHAAVVPPPDYRDCPPPSKRARHTSTNQDWKSSVLDTLRQPVAKAAPPSTSYFVVNSSEFEKHGYYSTSYEPFVSPDNKPLPSLPNSSTSTSGIREKLAAIVSTAGEWIDTLRKDPGGTKRRTDHVHVQHGHQNGAAKREPGKWTARVAAFWKKPKDGSNAEHLQGQVQQQQGSNGF